MNLKHLRIFHAVAETGSVSAGASRLYISQPAVTRQLKDLEARLGTCLFDRLPRGVRVTEAGAMLQEYAQRIFGLEREAERGLREIENLQAGELYIGASTTIGDYLLPRAIAAFRGHYPKVLLSVEIANTERIEQLLEAWALTLGFIEGPSNHPTLCADVILHDELVPVVSGEHPLANCSSLRSEDIVNTTFILRERGSGTRQVVEKRLQEHSLSSANPLYVGSTEAIKRLVIAGVGMGWLPQLSIAFELQTESLAIVPLAELVVQRPLYRIHHPDHRLSTSARAFIKLLRESNPIAAGEKDLQ